MGHKRIDETMLYVHVADAHQRDLPEAVQAVGNVSDPDRRVIAMMGARGKVLPRSTVSPEETAAIFAA